MPLLELCNVIVYEFDDVDFDLGSSFNIVQRLTWFLGVPVDGGTFDPDKTFTVYDITPELPLVDITGQFLTSDSQILVTERVENFKAALVDKRNEILTALAEQKDG